MIIVILILYNSKSAQEVFYTEFTKQPGQKRGVAGNDEGEILTI